MIEKIFHKDSFFVNKFDGDSKIIQSHIEHILSFDKGRKISNIGGYQSNDVSFGFHELITFAVNSLASINENVRLSNFWINVNQGKDYNQMHVHDLYAWSIVYYHKVCCEKSTLNFHHLIPTIYKEEFKYSPKEREMIFFKGIHPHSVSPCYEENHVRISIAFNFVQM